jgi:hypothetical protein
MTLKKQWLHEGRKRLAQIFLRQGKITVFNGGARSVSADLPRSRRCQELSNRAQREVEPPPLVRIELLLPDFLCSCTLHRAEAPNVCILSDASLF